MPKRTYVDSCLLLAALKGESELGRRALEILDDPSRTLVLSEAVRLEVMPKPIYEKRNEETDFYQAVFDVAECHAWSLGALQHAKALAEQHGIAAMDAIHVAHALEAQVDEFVTAEKSSKPMFRVKAMSISSIRPA